MFKASYNRENAEEVEVWNHPLPRTNGGGALVVPGRSRGVTPNKLYLCRRNEPLLYPYGIRPYVHCAGLIMV
jgi:hypothetical protein